MSKTSASGDVKATLDACARLIPLLDKHLPRRCYLYLMSAVENAAKRESLARRSSPTDPLSADPDAKSVALWDQALFIFNEAVALDHLRPRAVRENDDEGGDHPVPKDVSIGRSDGPAEKVTAGLEANTREGETDGARGPRAQEHLGYEGSSAPSARGAEARGLETPAVARKPLTEDEKTASYFNKLANSLLQVALTPAPESVAAARFAEWRRAVAAAKVGTEEVVPDHRVRTRALKLLGSRRLATEALEMLFTIENPTVACLTAAADACRLPAGKDAPAQVPFNVGGSSTARDVALGSSWWPKESEAGTTTRSKSEDSVEVSDLRVRLALLDTIADVLKASASSVPSQGPSSRYNQGGKKFLKIKK